MESYYQHGGEQIANMIRLHRRYVFTNIHFTPHITFTIKTLASDAIGA
jgi:hypothetical protein